MERQILETFNLTRRFGSLLAVDQLELRVPQGSIYGFLGPNGAGKTTTIRMLLGLIKPTAGNIQLFGGPLKERPTEVLRKIGSLVEMPSFYPHLTARENLKIVSKLRGESDSQINRVLAIVNLQKDANRLVRHYSLGMCQRLGLAIALLGDPKLLILDEPTNGLDPAGIHEIRELIQRLPQENGVTLFVSSHLLSEVEQIANQIGIIQNGHLIFQGTPNQLRAKYCDHINLGVDQPEKALQLLIQSGWKAQHNGDHHIAVTANGSADAAIINTQLIQAGMKVFQLNLEQPSLEDIFLKLTENDLKGVLK